MKHVFTEVKIVVGGLTALAVSLDKAKQAMTDLGMAMTSSMSTAAIPALGRLARAAAVFDDRRILDAQIAAIMGVSMPVHVFKGTHDITLRMTRDRDIDTSTFNQKAFIPGLMSFVNAEIVIHSVSNKEYDAWVQSIGGEWILYEDPDGRVRFQMLITSVMKSREIGGTTNLTITGPAKTVEIFGPGGELVSSTP